MKDPEIAVARPPRRRSRSRAAFGCDLSLRVRAHQRGVHDVTPADLPPQIRQRTVAKARTLLEALPFMREHHGKVIVVKYGGAAMDTVRPRPALVRRGRRPAAERGHHGGRRARRRAAGDEGVRTARHRDDVRGRAARDRRRDARRRHDGARRASSTPRSWPRWCTAACRRWGCRGSTAACCSRGSSHGARPRVRGRGRARQRRRARTLTDQRFVPVVASIAVDETTGQAYNVNADVVASELAIALGAEKLVFINDVPGLIGPDRRPAERAVRLAVPGAAGARPAWS